MSIKLVTEPDNCFIIVSSFTESKHLVCSILKQFCIVLSHNATSYTIRQIIRQGCQIRCCAIFARKMQLKTVMNWWMNTSAILFPLSVTASVCCKHITVKLYITTWWINFHNAAAQLQVEYYDHSHAFKSFAFVPFNWQRFTTHSVLCVVFAGHLTLY